MKYDLSAKRLFELGGRSILRSVLGYEVGEEDALQELSQETTFVLKRADYVLRVTPPRGEPWILLVEFLTEWRPAKADEAEEWGQRNTNGQPAKGPFLCPHSFAWNIFTTFSGLRDADQARQIKEKRKDLMRESPIYQDILEEGREEGRKEGWQKGRKEGWQEGREQERRESVKFGLEMKFGARALGLVSRIDRVHDAEALPRIREALRAGQSLEEIKRIIAASD